MSTTNPNSPRRGPLTEREFNVACEVYANTGSKHAAILSISGGATDATGRPSRRRTLEDALRANPEWAARWEEARSLALGRVEQAIAAAAFRIDTRPIFDKSGKLLGVQQDSRPSNDMLKFMAKKLSPEWRETKQLQIEGTIDHSHTRADGFGLYLTPDDVLHLDGEDRAKFLELLTLIRNRRTPENPNVIDEPATRSIRQLDSRGEVRDSE
ncbi:MAG: hypothetical protein KF691_07110 [Phycisphaeraceae bacterium]|nr:hypothetical protein [Phycisphaeraceae bacterium]